MRIIGCDLHARQQAVAMLDTETGEVVILRRITGQVPDGKLPQFATFISGNI